MCSKTFHNKKTLLVHKEALHVVDPQVCPECGLTLPNKEKLKEHTKLRHRKTPPTLFKCQYCDYTSVNSHVVREHERTHTGEQAEVCSFCGKGFATKKTRMNHERLHTGEKPYLCRYCESKFTQRTGVNVHVNTHHKAEVASAGPKDKHYIFQSPMKALN